MRQLGCSTRIVVIILLLVFLLFIGGLISGTLGSSLLGDIGIPSFMKVSGKPHVELPAENISHQPLLSLGPLGDLPLTNTLIASWLTIIVLVGFFYAATRKMRIVPGRLQCLVEAGLEMLLNFVEGTAGKNNGRMFFPVVATIFIFVLANAYLALLPFFGPSIYAGEEGVPLFRAANTDINLPLAIAVMSFFFVELWGMRRIGTLRYISTFINLGQLRQGMGQLFRGKIRAAFSGIMFGAINLFVGVLEGFSHMVRLISFTFRLFGNMTAGEILLIVVCFLVPWIATIPFYGLELLIGFIQALIFAGLTLVFAIVATTAHDEEHEEAS